MRKIYFAGLFTLLLAGLGYSQNIPQGMNYQAIARDKSGKELANSQISLQISLYSPQAPNPYYTETHSVTTNQFGLFSLVIGQGTVQSGSFATIPWSQDEIWMQVGIQTDGQSTYTPIGSSKLYAVPYAFYAGNLVNKDTSNEAKGLGPAGVNSQCPCNGGIKSMSVLYLGPSGVTIRVYNNQNLQNNGLIQTFTAVSNGAVLTINVPANIGTLQNVTYFQFSAIQNPPAVTAIPTVCANNYSATNPASPGGTWGNISVISQTDNNGETCTACNVNGQWYLGGNAVLSACNTLGTLSNNDLVLISNNTPRLVVSAGGDVTVDNNLNVNEGLNVLGNVKLNQSNGATTNNGPFTVANSSPTTLTGTLTTTGATQLNNTLTVADATNLNSILNVNNKQSTDLTGTLTVGRETKLDSSLSVAGNSDLHGFLHVDNHAPAVFTGTIEDYGVATFDDQVLLTDASLNASGTSSGALVVAGGVGIGQTVYVGGPTYLLNSLSVGGNTDLFGYLHVDNQSPTVLTGTLADSGNATFFEHVTMPDSGLQSFTPFDGALVVAGGIGVAGNLNVGGSASFGGPVDFKSVVSFTDTVNSTNYTNGTVVVTGGEGIGKNLNVNGNVFFTRILTVGGNTTLNGSLSVSNNQETTLTGTLGVNGNTTLGGFLDVNNNQPTDLTGTLTVGHATTLNGTLTANGRTVINADVDAAGDHTVEGAYPLEVKGSKEGIRIQVTGNSSGTPDMTNDFIQFTDASGTPRGSIVGETVADLSQDVGYITQEAELSVNLAIVTAQVAQAIGQEIAAASSVTGCEGLGVCVTDPIPSFIVSGAFNLGIAIANEALAAGSLTAYTVEYQSGLPGIYFNSGSGDYAEWLPKANPAEKIYRGDIVGVKGGLISKSTEGAEKLMVISEMPIVLGNSPPKDKEGDFEKVAFIGQVHVKVFGKVKAGDYILATAGGTGFGLAKHPADMAPEDYQKIVGTAWEGSDANGMSYVNTAVGINTNDVAKLAAAQETKIKAQSDEINTLKQEINETNAALAKLVPGFSTAVPGGAVAQNAVPATQGNAAVKPEFNSIQYREISRAELEEGLKLAEENLRENGQTAKNNIFIKKLEEDPNYKEQLIKQIQEKVKQQIELDKQIDKQFGR